MEHDENDARVASTEALLRLDLRARQDGLNRSLPPSLRERLDPNGYHVLSVALAFHNGVDATPYPHHRVTALLKVADTWEPQEALLDVATTELERLPLGREMIAMMRQLDDDEPGEADA